MRIKVTDYKDDFGLMGEAAVEILRTLCRNHQGLRNAVSLPRLAAMTDMNTRAVQSRIKSLVESYGVPIGGATAGIFMITNAREAEMVATNMRRRAFSCLRRYRAVNKITDREFRELIQKEFPFMKGANNGGKKKRRKDPA